MLNPQVSANILLLCGPTGVGKSTLGHFLIESALTDAQEALETQPQVVPAIWVEAPASGEKEFSWRLFYQKILAQLEGELDLPRTDYGVDPSSGRLIRPLSMQGNRLSSLRTAVERSLRARQTRFIVVDEAAHMMRQSRPDRLEQQLDTLKSLSNEYGVRWVLLGSYDLFEMMSLSGQLARRTHVIHLARYREDVPEDVRAFKGCLVKLANDQPALRGIDLLRYADVFQQNTIGCIGTLHAVLSRLNELVAQNGFSEAILCRALLTDAQATQILAEVLAGEARIASGLGRGSLQSPALTATRHKVA